MQNLVLTTDDEAATQELADTFSTCLAPGDVVALEGDLGAGKTFFARAVCASLSVPRSAGVSSPTYCLVNLYEGGRWPIAHLDLYRLDGEDELEAIGFRDLLTEGRLIIIEWPDRVPELRALSDWWIRIEDTGPQSRRFLISSGESHRAKALVAAASVRSPH